MTQVAQTLTAETTEREAASRLGAALLARGADPVVLLVAGEQRLPFRHPLPAGAPLGGLAMLVVCARRHGQITNVTRWIGFGRLDTAVAERFTRIREVETAFLGATRPGRAVKDVLADGIASYAGHGFDPTEWTHHHQGGPTGSPSKASTSQATSRTTMRVVMYFGRDPAATPAVADVVVLDQAFAWNPSAPGTKTEDTVLLTAAGIECLTVDADCPTVRTSSGARRADVMLL